MNLVAAKSKVRFAQPAGFQMNGSQRWPPSTKTWHLSCTKPFGAGVDMCGQLVFGVPRWMLTSDELDSQCCSYDLDSEGTQFDQFEEIRSVLMCVGHI